MAFKKSSSAFSFIVVGIFTQYTVMGVSERKRKSPTLITKTSCPLSCAFFIRATDVPHFSVDISFNTKHIFIIPVIYILGYLLLFSLFWIRNQVVPCIWVL